MNIRNEKGATVIDIAISLIIITMFIAIIANLIANINLNSKDVERKTIATSYAVQEIEKIKSQGIGPYIDKGISNIDISEEDIIINKSFTGYHKKVLVKDYILLSEDNTKQKNLIKEITVEISYKLGNKDKNVTISTCITKE